MAHPKNASMRHLTFPILRSPKAFLAIRFRRVFTCSALTRVALHFFQSMPISPSLRELKTFSLLDFKVLTADFNLSCESSLLMASKKSNDGVPFLSRSKSRIAEGKPVRTCIVCGRPQDIYWYCLEDSITTMLVYASFLS